MVPPRRLREPSPSVLLVESLDAPRRVDAPIGVPGLLAFGPKIPGTRCPTCALAGKEVWVIPGRCCGYCGTPCDGLELLTESNDSH